MSWSEDRTRPVKPATATELGVAAAVLILAIATQILLFNSLYLFRRNFWVDELYTHALVSDPDVGHSLRAVAAGFDSNPPGLQVLLRGFTTLTGDTSEVGLRAFALLAVLLALLGVYAIIRRVFAPLTSFTATMAVWVHPVILVHAFEVRYYGPWLASVVWFSYFLVRSREPTAGVLSGVLLPVSAVVCCTVHYFGVIALILVVGSELLARRLANRFSWAGVGPASLGPVALLACMPLLLSQRAAYTVPTWLDAPTLFDSAQFCAKLLLPMHLAALPMAAWVARLLGGTREVTDAPPGARREFADLAGLTGLALLPFVLVVFSFAVQSALVDRYALPAVAALAPATAFLVFRMPRFWALAFCVFLLLTGALEIGGYCKWYRELDQQTAGLIATIRERTGEEAVVFESPHELYVVCRYAPDLARRCFALDFERGQVAHADQDRALFLRDSMRSYAKFYPSPELVTWDVASRWPGIYLVPGRKTLMGVPTSPEGRYPGFAAQSLGAGLYRLTPVQEPP